VSGEFPFGKRNTENIPMMDTQLVLLNKLNKKLVPNETFCKSMK
jgi:hypothetical protein